MVLIVTTVMAASELIQQTLFVCAALSLLMAIAFSIVARRAGRPALRRGPASPIEGRLAVAALSFGVGVACIQGLVLVGRLLESAIDLVRGSPGLAEADFGFGPAGLWSLGLIFAACLVAFSSLGGRRLGTCLLWCASLIVTWGCLLTPVLRRLPSSGYERSGSTLWLMASWSAVLTLAIAADALMARRRQAAECGTSPGGLDPTSASWPGLPISVIVIATALLLLTAYHLAVPIRLEFGGYSVGATLVSGSAGVAAVACFSLLRRVWSKGLADVSLGLTSLAFCGAATAAIPAEPTVLARRYPLLFSAMIIGLSLSTVLWASVAAALGEALAKGSTSPWSRLLPDAKRFAFLNASLALLMGLCLAIWPRRPTVSVADDSLGQVAAGLAANLFLLLVLLWCSRRLKSVPFHILTVLALLSAAGFVVARMLPFTPRFG